MERMQELRCEGGEHDGETVTVDICLHQFVQRHKFIPADHKWDDYAKPLPTLGDVGAVVRTTYEVRQREGSFYLAVMGQP